MIASIHLRGVTKRFGPTTALRGVTLEIGRGLTLIEGPNGSGKSTLLGVIGQVIRPTSGSIEYAPFATGAEARGEMGWLSHDSLCYGDLTGKQSVCFAARVAGFDAEAAWTRAVERFDLGGFAERKLRTNSRGQRQRIALARALASQPSVVLLDEPTTGLDRRSTERLVALLKEELERDAIVVLVTHEPVLFGDLPTSRIVVEAGRANVS